jgi:hypothetical protein
MGEGSEGIAASSRGGESDKLGSCETHHVSISPQKNFGVPASEMGEGEGGSEGGSVGLR